MVQQLQLALDNVEVREKMFRCGLNMIILEK